MSRPYKETIVRILLKYRLGITTGRIAEIGGMSWNTADKYLKLMEEDGWVYNRNGYWRANVRKEDFPEYYEDDY